MESTISGQLEFENLPALPTVFHYLDRSSRLVIRQCSKKLLKEHDALAKRLQVAFGSNRPPPNMEQVLSTLKRILDTHCKPSHLLLRSDGQGESDLISILGVVGAPQSLAELRMHECALTPSLVTALIAAAPKLRKLTLSGSSVGNESLAEGFGVLLQALPCIEHCGMYLRDDAPENAWRALAQHSSIHGLEVVFPSRQLQGLSLLTNIQALSMTCSHSNGVKHEYRRCFAALTGLTSLKRITSGDRQSWDYPALPGMSSLVNLRELDVHALWLSSEDLHALPQLTALTSLKAGGVALDAIRDAARRAGSATAARPPDPLHLPVVPWQLPPNLRHLRLRQRQLDLRVLAGMQAPPSLTAAQLNDAVIIILPCSDTAPLDKLAAAVKEAARWLVLPSRFLHLRLEGLHGPVGLHALWPALGCLQQLQQLVVSRARLEEGDLRALGASELGASLQTLTLRSCRVDSSGLSHLLSLPRLRTLQLGVELYITSDPASRELTPAA
ncbi:hypothetical protein Agub_g7409, partial [Astrephomene gubernaculifera]